MHATAFYLNRLCCIAARRSEIFALSAVAVLASIQGGRAATFEITSDQKSTVSGARLCLAVDQRKPVVPAKGAVIKAPGAERPIPLSGTFYPVIVMRCDQLSADYPSQWSMTDTRELRITVRGAALCLSTRTLEGFEDLIDPWLAVFQATRPGSQFEYLDRDYKPGASDTARQRRSPPLLVNICNRSDASDFWAYDDLTGTISSPRGNRACVAIYSDEARKPAVYDSGMPVNVTWCPELRAYKRDGIAPTLRWTISAAKETLPTYRAPDLAAYFSGADGLPVTGPMGRCLTADAPSAALVTSDCDGRVEQNWKFVGKAIRLGANGDCLTLAGEGNVSLAPCRDEASQKWMYRVRDPVPNAKWLNADVYGQIHPDEKADQCLAATLDPFADPVRQRNPVKVMACSAVRPRQTSWFRPVVVRTLRLALLRYADDDGGNSSNGNATDERVKQIMENLALRLSEYYARLGVRFVFDPDHDYLRVNDTVANQAKNRNPDNTTNWDSPNRGTKVAATTHYGKVTIIIMAGYRGGGSSGGVAEFEIERMIQHISRKPETSYHLVPGLPKDKNGMSAVSNNVSERSVGESIGSVSHHAHELGHYFGLAHTFNQDEFGDTPDDIRVGVAWEKLGTTACGNPRTVAVNGKQLTPDRLNNQGYFGCLLGRSHNAFSPLQLGHMSWMLNNQLNRYPLVACQPRRAYDANRVECENAESLALCQETAAYLKRKDGTSLVCESGGHYTREITAALQQPAVRYLLQDTPAGRSIVNKLAGSNPRGNPPSAATFNAVADALKTSKNLPLTMAMVNRVREFRQLASQNASLAKTGFAADGPQLSGADRKTIDGLSGQVFTPKFVVNAPNILGR